MVKRVLLATRDLFFRSKLQGIVKEAGAEATREEPCDLAIVELGAGSEDRIRALVGKGIPVLAFGSHVLTAELRAAREIGARAVPNSEIESALRALLQTV